MSRVVKKIIKKIVDKFIGSGLSQDANTASGERYVTAGIGALIRKAGAEGIVLLENDGVLPLKKGAKIAVFGRCQYDYLYVGYGSGGDVHAPYLVNLIDGLKAAEKDGKIVLNNTVTSAYEEWRSTAEAEIDPGFWGHWPMHYPEMPIGDLAKKAAIDSDIAIVVIGRTAGEDRENLLEEGSYYLTDIEKDMLDKVTESFAKTIVIMDCGNIVDLSYVVSKKLSALLYAFMGGMESGNALTDVLTGKVSPSGKLPSTIAKTYEDYPSSANFGQDDYNNYVEDIYVGYRYFESFRKDRVLYPFGYGLSYSNFSRTVEDIELKDNCKLTIKVKNIGKIAAKDVVSLYVECPEGKLKKPSRVLVGFAKTAEIKPQEECCLELSFQKYDYASYDEKSASYILEKGEYSFYLGDSVRAAQLIYQYIEKDDAVLCKLRNVLKVASPFKVLKNHGGQEVYEDAFVADYDLKDRIIAELPKNSKRAQEKYTYQDVKAGRCTVEELVSTLTIKELEGLTRGIGYMSSPLGTKGNAGSLGGTTPALLAKGVPPIITTDGPAGIRVAYYTSLLPCGTALAATFNTALIEELYTKVAEEMEHYNTDVLLAPGLNIHRSPLCGRNFEYFSEDPLLTGKAAAAFVRGVEKYGKAACSKHFACNNQESKRFINDSRVSERALREIYLKGFEICIKESSPKVLMTSYNKINGIYSYYNYDLATSVLRKEWGYDGLVITDWWMRKCVSPDFPKVEGNAYRIRAGVDILMPGNFSKVLRKYKLDPSLQKSLKSRQGITRSEVERTAIRTINLAIKLGK